MVVMLPPVKLKLPFNFCKMSISNVVRGPMGKISWQMHFNIRISFTCQIFIDFAKPTQTL